MRKQSVRSWNGSVVAILTYACILGAATMQWAKDLMQVARHDAWLSVLLTTGVTALLVGLILLATNLHPQAKPGGLFVVGLGPWLGRAASLGFVIYLVANAARELRTTAELLHYSVLPRTPGWALVIFAAVVMAVTLSGGIGAVIRFTMTLFWPTLILALFSLAIGFRFSDWANLLPVLSDGISPVLAGLRPMMEPVLGLELLLVYLLYARQAKVPARDLALGALLGALGAIGTYLYTTLAIMVGFGPWEAAGMTWPVMEAVRRTYLIGLFFERLDLLFLIVFLIATASSLNLSVYAGIAVLRESLGLPGQKWQLWGLAGLVSACALAPRNLTVVTWWQVHFVEPLGAFYLIAVPLLLIGTGLWRRHRRQAHAQTGT